MDQVLCGQVVFSSTSSVNKILGLNLTYFVFYFFIKWEINQDDVVELNF
jgi:hypothetical protein